MTTPAYDDNITPRQLEQALYRQAHKLNLAMREFRLAEKTWKALYNLKEEMFERIKTKHDVIEVEDGKKTKPKTNAQLEREATLDSEWIEFRNGMDAAEEKMGDAKVNWKVAETNWDTTRSILSSRNSERRTNT